MQLNNVQDLSNILRILMTKGYTEAGIASAVQVSQSTISRILSGKIRYPTFQTVMKIQKIFQQYCP